MQQTELQHYGVKGMKWGVRRATKILSSSSATDERKKKAAASLVKHRQKATKKVSKLESNRPELQKAYDKAITKTDVKIADIQSKQAKLNRKANRFFTSDRKATKLYMKSAAMDMRIKDLKAQSDMAKAEMAKNEHMISLFKQGIKDIDSAIASRGRKYING